MLLNRTVRCMLSFRYQSRLAFVHLHSIPTFEVQIQTCTRRLLPTYQLYQEERSRSPRNCAHFPFTALDFSSQVGWSWATISGDGDAIAITTYFAREIQTNISLFVFICVCWRACVRVCSCILCPRVCVEQYLPPAAAEFQRFCDFGLRFSLAIQEAGGQSKYATTLHRLAWSQTMIWGFSESF